MLTVSGHKSLMSDFAWGAIEAGMRVDDRMRKAVAFVGCESNGAFVPIGTAFITANTIDGSVFQTVVTARHVIERVPGDLIYLRLNTRAGRAELMKAPKTDWISHPDPSVDLSVCPSVISHELYDILHFALDEGVLTDEAIAQDNIGVGDEVAVAGMYISRLGETKNIPILRIGTIAAMAEEKMRTEYGYHHAYLIEARSIDGLSGSPVYVIMPPWRYKFEADSVKPYMHSNLAQYFMGVLLGTSEVHNPVDTLEIKSAEETSEEPQKARMLYNTGIGVVLPISYVIEAVNQPKIRDKRLKGLREIDPDRRYRATAAHPSFAAESSEAETVQHKEDFTRLLNVAARKRESEH